MSWASIPRYGIQGTRPSTRISVIIPARNEENNIGGLLNALQNQSYPKILFEVIVVDDHSNDRTVEIVKQFAGVKSISLKEKDINSYKKKAIEKGIAAASGDLIVATDADCIPGSEWLSQLAAFKESENGVFIAAPVVINCNNSIVQVFQAMDFMVLQGITGAVVHRNSLSMCNGANLAYDRKVFYEVGGFINIDHIASGDDMLLMHKIRSRYPGGVRYLKSKDAIVSTQPVKTWKEFFSQRIRWASKARQYNDKRILPVLVLVYLVNLSFPALIIAGFFDWRYWIAAVSFLVLKTLVEFPFFISLTKFFDKQWAIRVFPLFQPLHIFYTIISGLFGQFGKYEWKGRKVR
jgi:cellulose synthase/poly-beta-1,6-N-acetylglucosamine synthase-like glycosyltransferase